MKISFVIPAYNEEAYIKACLTSVCAARAAAPCACEIIVVNNASTDATARVARAFADVRVIDEPRKGLSRARQTGFAASTGDIIANIDADTQLTPQWMETVTRSFTHNEHLVALSGPCIFYDASPSFNRMVRVFYYAAYPLYVMNRFVFNSGSMLQGGNFVVRRSALEACHGYDVAYDFYGEDAAMARRLHPLGEVVFTFALPIYSSGRRVLKEGPIKMATVYALNYVWSIFFKRPFTRTALTIR